MNYNAQKKCDFCGESIPVSANRCPYCASILEVTVDNTFDPSGTEQQSLFMKMMQARMRPALTKSMDRTGDKCNRTMRGQDKISRNPADGSQGIRIPMLLRGHTIQEIISL